MNISEESLSIGQVLEQLKPSFPDLSISKIRFLEKEQLITPERTTGGYRKFKQADILRLKKTLELQKNEYLPLNVIRERLAAWDPRSNSQENADKGGQVENREYISRNEAMNSFGFTSSDLDELEKYGMLVIKANNGEQGYDSSAIDLLPIFAAFKEFGVQGRHLKLIRTNAEKQLALIDQALSPQMRKIGDPAKKQAVLIRLIDLAQRLNEEFLNYGLKNR